MLHGFAQALAAMAGWDVVLGLVLGVVVGYTVGSLPGLTSSIGIALMVPFTFAMSPVVSITLLVTLYMATEYAGAIPAILVNTPGVPAAAITALDGYPMRLRGEAGTALTMSILSAAFGSIVSTLLLIVTATWIASFALAFGPVEYFALAVLGLSLVSSLASGSMLKGFIGLFFGLAIGVIGTDPLDGVTRYVLTDSMLSGISFLPALIGLFALSGVFAMIETAEQLPAPITRVPSLSGQFGLMRPYMLPLIRSTLIGYVVSVIPGHGATISSMVAYAVQKRLSRSPETFGKGNPEGLVAAESAANASVPGALAPMLALGIPGSASTAVLIGALTPARRPARSAAVRASSGDPVLRLHRHGCDDAVHGRPWVGRRPALGAGDASAEKPDRDAGGGDVSAGQLRFAERYLRHVDHGVLRRRRLRVEQDRDPCRAHRLGAGPRLPHRKQSTPRLDQLQR